MIEQAPFQQTIMTPDGRFQGAWIRWFTLLRSAIEIIDGGAP
jgi:hypothetical protein